MLLPQETIRAKRDGRALSREEIEDFIAGLTSGAVSEGQAAAFAMAVFFRGMNIDERVHLTKAMMRSGDVLNWAPLNLRGPIVDKHSTGGVGDNVSLMLAPMLAACGAFVPMISGRGLGHTGGTLDKLDSIPGYVSQPDIARFRKVVTDAGCAIIGQTADLAPADKRLYAIRDVTATVESIALITASILSKKLAAGLQYLVMDVKTGNGAFMPTYEGASELAESLAHVATVAGLPTAALITDMNEPLASAAGNAVEVQNAVDYLTGDKRDARLHEVTISLGAELLALSGLRPDIATSRAALSGALASGAAAEHFERMVSGLGGPRDFLRQARALLPAAPIVWPLAPERNGWVEAIDTRAVGLAVVELGGGRARASEKIDPAVGFTMLAGLGAHVSAEHPLAFVHARSEGRAEAAIARLRTAYRIGDAPPPAAPPVVARVVPAAP
jgi:thymidine phosphorylase